MLISVGSGSMEGGDCQVVTLDCDNTSLFILAPVTNLTILTISLTLKNWKHIIFVMGEREIKINFSESTS